MESWPACDECDAIATVATRDIKEIDPFKDEGGKLWRCWDADGETHYRCAEHPRPSRRTYLDGRIRTGLSCLAESIAHLSARAHRALAAEMISA